MDRVDMMVFQHAQRIPDNRRGEFQMLYQGQRKDRTTALLLSLFLGSLGVDRFYLGQTGLGVAKLLTLGGCLLWSMIDWFMIMGATDTHNTMVLQRLSAMYPAQLAPGYQAPQLGWQ